MKHLNCISVQPAPANTSSDKFLLLPLRKAVKDLVREVDVSGQGKEEV